MKLQQVIDGLKKQEARAIARAISIVEDNKKGADAILSALDNSLIDQAVVLGITGPPGAGKSTLTNQIISEVRKAGKKVGIIAIDPSSSISGGAVLGDRIRMMQHALDRNVIMRSMASRGRLGGLCSGAGATARIMSSAGCEVVIIETVGVGQLEMDVISLADVTALVLAPGLGDEIQAMKAGVLEVADALVVNKADCQGADALVSALQSVLPDYQRENRKKQIFLTEAVNGKGVDELLGALLTIDQHYRENGEHRRRRSQARKMETIDWGIDLLRPQLKQFVEQCDFAENEDPKLVAHKIIKKLNVEE